MASTQSQSIRWLPLGFAASALAVCYAPVLHGLYLHWMTDEDMGHGFVVPLVIVWIVWRERERLMKLPSRPSVWGLAAMLFGALLQSAATLSAGLFLGSVALLVSLAGVVVFVYGFGVMHAAAFPALLSLFMLPKLSIVYTKVTLPLQLLASEIADAALTAAGQQVARNGTILTVNGHSVEVAEACSGIRYLLPLAFVALIYGYLVEARPWMRIVLFAASVPLAILANGLRVGAMAAFPVLESGTPHVVAGAVIFVLCVGALAGIQTLSELARRKSRA
jgi:exosortase